jgi:hypothetical protein
MIQYIKKIYDSFFPVKTLNEKDKIKLYINYIEDNNIDLKFNKYISYVILYKDFPSYDDWTKLFHYLNINTKIIKKVNKLIDNTQDPILKDVHTKILQAYTRYILFL